MPAIWRPVYRARWLGGRLRFAVEPSCLAHWWWRRNVLRLDGLRRRRRPSRRRSPPAPDVRLGATAIFVDAPATMAADVTVAPIPSELMAVGGNVSRIAVVNVPTGATVPCQSAGSQLECQITAAGSYTTVLVQATASPVVQQGVSQARTDCQGPYLSRDAIFSSVTMNAQESP
jgi:hypothetical protein